MSKKHIAKELLAYFSGFFDGEGCIHIAKYKPRNKKTQWQLRTLISNVNPGSLKLLKEIFGGKIYLQPGRGSRRKCWYWIVTSKAAEEFLRLILPYLIIKKEEAILALEFRITKNKYWYLHELSEKEEIEKDEYKNDLSALKQREWATL